MVHVRVITSTFETVPVGRGRLPSQFAVETGTERKNGARVRADFEVRDGVPICRSVHLEADGAQGIRGSDLAAVRLLDLRDIAVHELVLGDVTEIAPGEYLVRPPSEAGRAAGVRDVNAVPRRRGNIDLALVADLYRANVGNAPTQAVADHFGVAHRTAVNYVRRARDAGHLGAAIPGKAGERQ